MKNRFAKSGATFNCRCPTTIYGYRAGVWLKESNQPYQWKRVTEGHKSKDTKASAEAPLWMASDGAEEGGAGGGSGGAEATVAAGEEARPSAYK